MDSNTVLENVSTVQSALLLFVRISAPIVLAALVGAFVAGLLRVITQIDDAILSYAGKLCAIAVLAYFMAGYVYSDVVEFTEHIWAGNTYYR